MMSTTGLSGKAPGTAPLPKPSCDANPLPRSWSLHDDLDAILSLTASLWPSLDGAHIFLTGGTGFIGCWLLETIRHADLTGRARVKVTVLTRHRAAFAIKAPHLASHPAFEWLEGDVCGFEFPPGRFTHLIHAATDASAHLNEHDPLRMFDTVVLGSRRALEFAATRHIGKVLFLSSGAVYGRQPEGMPTVPESWLGAPACQDARHAYAEGKRAAEMLCSIFARQFGVRTTIARIFALLGPYLPLDIHFAAGNFIRDAMCGRPVIVQGNGLPERSYLYASDLTVWLLHLLVRANPGTAYNVGSDAGISMRELARLTADRLAHGAFEVLGANDAGWNTGRYVPDTGLIQRELGVGRTVPLSSAIERTARWHGWTGKESQG